MNSQGFTNITANCWWQSASAWHGEELNYIAESYAAIWWVPSPTEGMKAGDMGIPRILPFIGRLSSKPWRQHRPQDQEPALQHPQCHSREEERVSVAPSLTFRKARDGSTPSILHTSISCLMAKQSHLSAPRSWLAGSGMRTDLFFSGWLQLNYFLL